MSSVQQHVPPPAPETPPHRAALRWWLVAIGLIAVLGAVGVRMWQARQPEPAPVAAIPDRIDKNWAEREKVIQASAEEARKTPPAPDMTPAHPVSRVPANAEPDLSAFRINQDDRTYDMRGWKEVAPGDGPHTASVVMTRRLRLTKLAPADRIDFLARTSGADLVMRCVAPNPEKATVAASDTKPIRAGREMVEQRLSADVSTVAVGADFDLTFKVTYWNSLQTPDERWFGTTGYDGSKLLALLILFPESRPFQGAGLRSGPDLSSNVWRLFPWLRNRSTEEELEPYAGTQMAFKGTGGSWMYWEVPGPKTGTIYRADWKW